ncbi:sigma-54-dependent Fis family transcriptional regulator [archaeon]|jgi:transcriptional regulator with PAS, ATPase and Fis domain|nr:sigma-54-dependent Fis family transcriptional regulator [archaeon]MBT6821786.1 sigma-54-dependent Fis family transcriptional regulator [archaeon]
MDNIYSNLGIPLQDQKILKKYSILKKIDDAINNIQKDYGYTEKERNLLDSFKVYLQNTNIIINEKIKNDSEFLEQADNEFDKSSTILSPQEDDLMKSFFKDHKILSENRLMLKIFKDILKFKKRTNVLITGESGTGKEGIAHAFHKLSKRKGIIAMNMAGSPDMLESDLFGHVKGAFTDAIETVNGAIQLACNGTLFLDEIGDIPLKIQKTLLRVLQEKKVIKRGSHTEEEADFRLISATNKNLLDCVKNGEMRKDFYRRINGILIHLPPLNSRRNDIPILANYFFQSVLSKIKIQDDPESKLNYNLKVIVSDFTMLESLDWSNGNVGELKIHSEKVAEAYFGYLESGFEIDRNTLHKLIEDPQCDIDEITNPSTVLTEEEENCFQLLIKKDFNIIKVSEHLPFGRDKVNSIINNSLLKLGSSYEYETKAIAISLTDILKIEKFNENEKLSIEINSRFIQIIKHHRPQPKIYSNDLNTNVEELIQIRKDLIPS